MSPWGAGGPGSRRLRPASPPLKDASGAAARLGCAESLTGGPLAGLAWGCGQGLR
ncbi:MAG: hypothetical protein JWL64_1490, partial [Frankiales bacterium]|nr:hypothetical protein [Frankiales bacterium]